VEVSPQFDLVKRILVIEDDAPIREVTVRLLTAAGYGVTAAVSGSAGLRAWREHGADLVLTDMRMLDMDGFQIIRELRTDAPDLPAVVMSGDTTGSGQRNAEPPPDRVGFLHKPFLRAQLLAVVEAALAAAGQPLAPPASPSDAQ
jgi:CheY-like chemotaxis protein